jgi:D-glycero-D-manno-heptose 1,7-bisphosphate phosphatase
MKGVIFDIDGTLTGALGSQQVDGFKKHSQDLFVLPGVLEGLEFCKNQGYVIVGASNQGGCSAINSTTGKPYKTIEDAIAEMKYTLSLIPQLKAIYFCPDFEGINCYKIYRDEIERRLKPDTANYEKCNYRKPGAGMLRDAAIDYGFDLSQSWMIGDRSEDMEAADNAGCDFMDAETWRMRFTPGMYEIRNVNLNQIEFLEGIKYKVGNEK